MKEKDKELYAAFKEKETVMRERDIIKREMENMDRDK
jgi:hypothetical protein